MWESLIGVLNSVKSFFNSDKKNIYAIYMSVSSIICILSLKYFYMQSWFESLVPFYGWILLILYFLVIISTVVLIVNYTAKRYLHIRNSKEQESYIEQLTDKEKGFLQEFIERGNKSTVVYYGNNIRHSYMVEKEILYRRGRHDKRISPQTIKHGYVYDISDWAWDYMKKNTPPND